MSHSPHDHAADHDHRHGETRDHAHGYGRTVANHLRGSLLDASAALRLVGAAGAMALIWVGVIWATS